jgi:hypothetical protein
MESNGKFLCDEDSGQIGIEGFAEGGLHAARARRWKILARLTGRDFSPDWMARSMAASSRLFTVVILLIHRGLLIIGIGHPPPF